MAEIRAAGVAGRFYPADAAALGAMLDGFLADARPVQADYKAIIAPHAGYVFSGPIAGTAYAALKPRADQIRRVVVLCPGHRYPVPGIAAPTTGAFATPLGLIPVDQAAIERIRSLPGVMLLDEAFEGEHAIEVQLPFLQVCFRDVALVPLIVGAATVEQIDAVLEALWGGPETLIVISSDLSHYLGYDQARKLDAETTGRFEALEINGLSGNHACGFRAAGGLMLRALKLDLRPTALDVRNSGDTCGDRSRVVGYGAYGFEYAASARLAPELRTQLVEVAKRTLAHTIERKIAPHVAVETFDRRLQARRRSFVTLTSEGKLRGCIGSYAPVQSLIADVVQNTFRAASADPRFTAITGEELPKIEIGIAILSTPRRMEVASEAELLDHLRPDQDGLILQDGNRRALFLPKVWDGLPDPLRFVRHLKLKAGLPAEHWSPTMQAFRFTTETF